MTDHLPECWIVSHSNPLNGCICAELRACEQRLLSLNPVGLGVLIAQRARERALDAAREALDQIASDMANWNSAETTAATSAMPNLSAEQWIWAQRGMHRALAAIDALLGGEGGRLRAQVRPVHPSSSSEGVGVNDDVTIEQAVSDAIGECAGYVSLCWDPRPTGVFDSALASAAVQNAVGRAHSAMQEERAAGYLSGLDAAREAVAAVPHRPDCIGHCPCCILNYDCDCALRDALDSIDALRQKP